MLTRRALLAGAAALTIPAYAKAKLDRTRLSIISDEAAPTVDEGIAFAKKHGLRWMELRGVPAAKKHYMKLTPEELKEAAAKFKEHGIGISYFNSPMLKIVLPGTENDLAKPVKPETLERHKAEFDRRMQDLDETIRAAHAFDVPIIRVFAFLRTKDPIAALPKAAEVIGEMAERCRREGLKIAVENEVPCNAATSGELAALMKLLPEKTVGLNWDPHNTLPHGEAPWPDGYRLLPRKRIWNVQIKGKSMLEPKDKLDWANILHVMNEDGYTGKFGLETHYFDGTMFEKSEICMTKLVEMAESKPVKERS